MKLSKLSVLAAAGFTVLAVATETQALTLSYHDEFGSPGFGPGELFAPQGIAIQESTGQVYIANGRGLNPDGSFNPDLGNRIEVYDAEGNFIGAVGEGGTGPGQFDEPAALGFNPVTGNLYAGDVYNLRINVFDPEGNFVRSFGEGFFSGLVEGRLFFGPSGIEFDEEGNVYVGDFSNDRILKFSASGELLDTFGSSGTEPGEFQGPAALRISPVTGNFVVTDQFNNRVQILSPEGEPITVFGGPGSEPGQFLQPVGVEVDEFGNIYIADLINSRIQVFDGEGNFLTQFGEPARTPDGEIVPPQMLGEPPFGEPLDLRPGVFNWTAGTALDDDELYVGDFFQGRVQVLKIEDAAPASVPEPTSILGLAIAGLGAAAGVIKKHHAA